MAPAFIHILLFPSILQIIGYGSHDANSLDLRCVLVAVVDGKLALRSGLNLAKAAMGIGCELVGGFAGIGRGLGYHLRLDAVQIGILVGRLILVVAGNYSYSLL